MLKLLHCGFFVGILTLACPRLVLPQASQIRLAQSSQVEEFSVTDAEILIYLLPEARQTRDAGMDVGWELETGRQQNTKDFYNFWVVNNERKGHIGSVTIGYFSVNKYTGEVWDSVSDKRIMDKEIQGIQNILRKAHHVDHQTLDKYQNIQP